MPEPGSRSTAAVGTDPGPPVGSGAGPAPEPGIPTGIGPTSATTSTARLVSAGAVMAAGTALSRVLGFVRLVLLAGLLANGTRQADMFAIANTVPNSMYILLAGGVLNTVLVPQLVRAIRTDSDQGETYTNRIMTLGLIGLAVITTTLTLAVPLIIRIYSGADWKQPQLGGQYESMVMLGYYCMPQVFFYGVHVLAGQVLNARDRFGPMMWAPIANNLVSIVVLIVFAGVYGSAAAHPTRTGQAFTPSQELLLGLGSTLGIVLQAAVLVPFLRSAGYRFRPRFDFRRTGLGKTVGLAKWTLGFVLVTQIALVVISRLGSDATASGGRSAGLAAYYNAYAVWILPHSLITVSLATAMLPSASRLAAAGDLSGVAEETARTIRLALTALVPASVAYVVLGLPVTRLAFGFGGGAADAEYVGWALMALAVGLVPFTVQYICLRAFYALEDTRTPFWLQVIISAANALLGLAIVTTVDQRSLVASGLAAAYSLAYMVGVVISFRRLRRRLPDLDAVPLIRHAARLLAAVSPAAAVAWAICWGIAAWSSSRLALIGSLVVAGIVAVAVFLLVARLLRIHEVSAIVASVLRRGGPVDEVGGHPGPAGPNGPSSSGDAVAAMSLVRPSIDGSADVVSEGLEPGDPTQNADVMAQAAAVRREMDPPGSAGGAVGMGTGPDPDDSGSPDHQSSAGAGVDGSAAAGEDDFAGAGDDDDFVGAAALPAGTLLGERYRLEELIAESRRTVTWRAFDQVLSRSVLIHLLAPGDPQAPHLLATARQASLATDSRFLRVLDAVHSDDTDIGSYIVCEFVVGRSLELILHQGPLSGLEAAWVVREVGDALSGVHALGLYHHRINPDTVIVTPTGNIKIVGLLIEAALRPRRSHEVPGADTAELVDVLDLGRLLYAGLVARWPGGPAFDLPDAPRTGRRWATPRQVRAGVSPALDNVCDQILGDPPRHRAPAIATANGVVNALTKVLGSADAALDLERRLQQPIPRVGGSPRTGGGSRPAAADPDQPTDPMWAVRPTVLPTAASLPPRVTSAAPPPVPTAAARTASGSLRRRQPQRWIAILILLVALLLGAAVVAGLTLNQRMAAGRRPAASPPAVAPVTTGPPASTAPAEGPITIVAATEFDPQGDPPNVEDPKGVPLAYDGDPTTRWHTVTYRGTPKLGNLKRGVGLVLDLGSAQAVGSVQLTLSGNGTAIDVRVPKGDAATVSSIPTKSDSQWRKIASDAKAGSRTTLRPKEPVTTRYLLVYLTSLPKEGKGYQGGIDEVVVGRS